MVTTRPQGRNTDALNALHDELQASLGRLVTSEDWLRALEVASRFQDYSFSNIQLIMAQAAARGITPTRVAGYRRWQELGRQVRKGERGLSILAPITRTITVEDSGQTGETGEKVKRVVGFRPVKVFDQSQTDGRPIPEVKAELVEGELDKAAWKAVLAQIRDQGFTVIVDDPAVLGDANGVTDYMANRVVIKESLPGAQRLKTAVHELAHTRLHRPEGGERPRCRGVVEVEAESVAYMVCASLGIDSAGYSLPYVAVWSDGDLDKVAATGNRVVSCARQILDGLHLELGPETPAVKPETPQLRERDVRDTDRTRGKRGRQCCGVCGEGPEKSWGEDYPWDPDVWLHGSCIDTYEAVRPSKPEVTEALSLARSYFQQSLHSAAGQPARRLLHERQVNDDLWDAWGIGYAPPRWQGLTSELRKARIPEHAMLEAGVVARSSRGRCYDRMRGRIIFTITDPRGQPRGFAGRLLGDNGPKYLNTPRTPLYDKSSLPYGLHLAHHEIETRSRAVVVEGYFDAIAAHRAGIANTIAIGGTALTEQHLRLLGTTGAQRITLAFDGDHGGTKAVDQVIALPKSKRSQVEFEVAQLPVGTDPAGLVEEGDGSLLLGLIHQAIPLLHHALNQHLATAIGSGEAASPQIVSKAVESAASLVDQLTDQTTRSQAVEHLAQKLRLEHSRVAQLLSEAPFASRTELVNELTQRANDRRTRRRDLGIGLS